MLYYVVRRILYMALVLLAISVIAFAVIQLPPGDYLTTYIIQLRTMGTEVGEAEIASLSKQYGLDLPLYQRYFKWMWGILHGNLGQSFLYARPVSGLIAERLPLTVAINILAIFFVYIVAIPIGIYSATHQYSEADYTFTILGFAGLAIPNFLLALILMLFFHKYFGFSVGGIFSPQYIMAPWSWDKFVDMLKHLPVPVIVEGTAGTAGLIRVMRGSLLDELQKQYVITARAKGVEERALLFKYPVKMAINPIISTIGWMLPAIISGGAIVEVVLSIPTIGPLLLEALLRQDMYLAGSCIMILSVLTVIGTFISDMLLVWIDPRIRLKKGI